MTTTHRVWIVDDHPMACDLLRERLIALGPPWEVVYCGGSLEAALDVCRSVAGDPRRDVALVDLDLGEDSDWLSGVRAFRDGGVSVILISAAGDPAQVQRGIAAGAFAYLPKPVGASGLLNALNALGSGTVHGTADLAGKLAMPVIAGVRLTDTESRVLMLWAAGMSPDAIAMSVGESPATVRTVMVDALAQYRQP